MTDLDRLIERDRIAEGILEGMRQARAYSTCRHDWEGHTHKSGMRSRRCTICKVVEHEVIPDRF